MLVPNDKAIDYGISKMFAFANVNRFKNPQEKIEALDTVAEAVGLGEHKLDYLIESLSEYFEDDIGFVVTGTLIGLFIAEHAEEHGCD